MGFCLSPAIVQAVSRGNRLSSEAVGPWSGHVYLVFSTRTEIKKDWIGAIQLFFRN